MLEELFGYLKVLVVGIQRRGGGSVIVNTIRSKTTDIYKESKCTSSGITIGESIQRSE